jgi:transcriptional regulator with XRE-family HTH domain
VSFSRYFKSIENKENDMLSSKQISRITELSKQGLSQREIAKKTGIDKNTVTKYSNPKFLKKILQRNERKAEKIEAIEDATHETRQDSKALRRELKQARKQQDRADDTHNEVWHKQQEIEEEAESRINKTIDNALLQAGLHLGYVVPGWNDDIQNWTPNQKERLRHRIKYGF